MGMISDFIQTKFLFLENISNNCQTNIAFTLKIRLFVQNYLLSPLFFLTFCVFLYMIIDSLNIGKRSNTLVFKKSKCLLYKYYPKFVKTLKKHPNKFNIRQFIALLYDCLPNMKNYYSIDRLLKDVNVLQDFSLYKLIQLLLYIVKQKKVKIF